MRRKGLSRILLLALIGVTITLVYKVFRDDWKPGTVVSLNRLGVDELNVTAFSVAGESTELVIQATGSLQSDTLMAAYPWILRRSDRSMVWKMKPESDDSRSGTLVSVEDRIWLDPDEYEVYFASFGNPGQPTAPPKGVIDKFLALFNDDFQKWRNESSKWQVSIIAGSEEAQARLRPIQTDESQPETPLAIWNSGPVESDAVAEFMFEAVRPVHVVVKCTGSVHEGAAGGGWIEDIESGRHVWDMATAETVHAGGAPNNKVCSQEVKLSPGLYRAIYKSDSHHGFDNWTANPPFDPQSWGFSISAAREGDLGSVSEFDPFETLPKIVSLTRIGNDALVSHTFTIHEPMRVLVHAEGEGYPGPNEMFDYAWVVSEKKREEIWKMAADKSKHGGGSHKNRRSEVVLNLEPGSYTVYYKSDGSHSYDDWNDDEPLNPRQWGVTVFSLNPNYVPTIDPTPPTPETVPSRTGKDSHIGGIPLVSLTGLGDYSNVTQSFTLPNESRIHIFALGEMTFDGRYDYGWITDRATNNVVWEMTRKNSEKAGGTSKNRRVDTVITLPPGEYQAHFKTDDSHSFPRFKYGGPPDNPDAWGIAIWLLVADAHGVHPEPPVVPSVAPVPPTPPTESDPSY